MALNYAIDYPNKVEKLVLIGTPYRVPKVMFSIQNIIFKFLPKSMFDTMAFNKKDTFILGKTMKNIDFSNRVQNIKSAHYLAENIKNAKLEIMKNTGHIVNEESPKELAETLTEFWKDW